MCTNHRPNMYSRSGQRCVAPIRRILGPFGGTLGTSRRRQQRSLRRRWRWRGESWDKSSDLSHKGALGSDDGEGRISHSQSATTHWANRRCRSTIGEENSDCVPPPFACRADKFPTPPTHPDPTRVRIQQPSFLAPFRCWHVSPCGAAVELVSCPIPRVPSGRRTDHRIVLCPCPRPSCRPLSPRPSCRPTTLRSKPRGGVGWGTLLLENARQRPTCCAIEPRRMDAIQSGWCLYRAFERPVTSCSDV